MKSLILHLSFSEPFYQLTALCKRLDDLWQENQGSVVLFNWIQFLKEEALEFLGLQSPLEIPSSSKHSQVERCRTDGASKRAENAGAEKKKPGELDPRAVLEAEPHADLVRQLLDFDEAQRQKVFDSTVFCCGICFSEKLGSDCVLFKECRHVYCRACVSEYFHIQIRDGKVQCLTCPEPKCTSVATPSQVSSYTCAYLAACRSRTHTYQLQNVFKRINCFSALCFKIVKVSPALDFRFRRFTNIGRELLMSSLHSL